MYCIEKCNVYNSKHIFLCTMNIRNSNTITDSLLSTLQLQNMFKSINQINLLIIFV